MDLGLAREEEQHLAFSESDGLLAVERCAKLDEGVACPQAAAGHREVVEAEVAEHQPSSVVSCGAFEKKARGVGQSNKPFRIKLSTRTVLRLHHHEVPKLTVRRVSITISTSQDGYALLDVAAFLT